jgi:transcription termination/antitermination protein NusG
MGFADPKSRRPWRDVIADLEARHLAQCGPRWHLVQCAPGEKDQHACDWLGRLGYEVYYPRIRMLRRVGRKRLSQRQRRMRTMVMSEVLAPLWPRYVCTRFDVRDGQWHKIFEIAGVTGLVCARSRPVPISDGLIARMRGVEVDGAIPGATPAAEIYRVGALVEIVDGPFAAFRGEIEQVRLGAIGDVAMAVQLTVAINIFGRLTPTDLEPWQVEAVDLAKV